MSSLVGNKSSPNYVVRTLPFLNMWIVCFIAGLILFNITVIFSLLSLHIIYRYLRLKYGRRIKANARMGALITGATSGLGLEAAKHMHKLGFSVFAGYFSNQEPGYKELCSLAATEIDKKLFLVELDVTSSDSIRKAYNSIDELCSRHNVELCRLVNNAGTARAGPFEWTSEDSITEGLDTNLKGLMLVTRQFMSMIVLNKGRVINVSSGLNQIPLGGASVYGSTKSGIAYFSEALHNDLKIYGCSSHAIMPGNLILNSSIIYSRVQSFQDSVKRLTGEEKQIFRKSIDRYSDSLYKILKVKIRSELDPQLVAKLYKFELPEDLSKPWKGKGEERRDKKRGYWNVLSDYLSLVDGRVKSLENSTAMHAFEQAVCLQNPPRRIYSGNAIFSYLTGPQLEFLPPLVGSLLGRLVSYTWDKQLRSYNSKTGND